MSEDRPPCQICGSTLWLFSCRNGYCKADDPFFKLAVNATDEIERTLGFTVEPDESQPRFEKPERIKLIGGPFDGETIAWPGGMVCLMHDRTRNGVYRYDYEPHREGGIITIKRAHFSGQER